MLFESRRAQFEKDGGKLPALPPHDPTLQVRIAYLFRLKALIDVGCHFAPDDLPPAVWDELILLEGEKALVDRVLDKRRDQKGREDREMGKARAQTGVPPPGGTLFQHSRPFKGSTR